MDDIGSNLQKSLESKKFVVTCEIGPPKGTNTHEIKEIADLFKGKADAINVTDLQSSVMRLGSLTVSHLLLDLGIEPIFQMTGRDRNRLALQSDLLSAYTLGIRNVLALTGDHTTIGDHPEAKPVYDLDSVTILMTMKKLESGEDLAGGKLDGVPSFFKGAVVNPGADTEGSMELQIVKMEKKIANGAQFFQTQAIFDADVFSRFIEKIRERGIQVPVLAGVILLKSEKMARYMNKFVPGIMVPDHIIQQMEKSENKVQTCIDIISDLINKVKPMCEGVHIQALGWEKHVPPILEKIH